jgi:hypothetical protein
MTPKEKAEELVSVYRKEIIKGKYRIDGFVIEELAEESALIAVDEIIESRKDDGAFDDTLSSTSSEYYTPHPMYLTYWLQVKTEIEKL